MTVQIKPSKPKDQFNGLAAIEAAILANPGDRVIAIVVYEVDKRVEDLKAGETYPVLGIKAIEPMLGDLHTEAEALLTQGYSARTGENELDFNFEGDVGDVEDDE